VDILTNIDLIKSSATEDFMRHCWSVAFGHYLQSNYRTQKQKQIFESVSFAVKFLILVSLIWFGARLVLEGQLTTGELVAFSMYASQAVVPLLGLITLWDEVQRARASLSRMQMIVDEKPERIIGQTPEINEGIRWNKMRTGDSILTPPHIHFENVWFYYPDRES
jgi:subfamily B ATP-binding cassette protein HlyB/CyaB